MISTRNKLRKFSKKFKKFSRPSKINQRLIFKTAWPGNWFKSHPSNTDFEIPGIDSLETQTCPIPKLSEFIQDYYRDNGSVTEVVQGINKPEGFVNLDYLLSTPDPMKVEVLPNINVGQAPLPEIKLGDLTYCKPIEFDFNAFSGDQIKNLNDVVSEYFKKCYPSFKCYNDTHSFTINSTDFESLIFRLNDHINELSKELKITPNELIAIASDQTNPDSIFNRTFVSLTGWRGVTQTALSRSWGGYLAIHCIKNIPTYRALSMTGVQLLSSGMTGFSFTFVGGVFFHMASLVAGGNQTGFGSLLQVTGDTFLVPTAVVEKSWNDFFRPIVFNTIGFPLKKWLWKDNVDFLTLNMTSEISKAPGLSVLQYLTNSTNQEKIKFVTNAIKDGLLNHK